MGMSIPEVSGATGSPRREGARPDAEGAHVDGGAAALESLVTVVTAEASGSLSDHIYRALRQRLLTGRISPGSTLSTRTLAHELGVSPMPVREAVGRLVAEQALEVHSKRFIRVPAMTRQRFEDLLRCRLLLEPEAARLALPLIDRDRLKRLAEIDDRIGDALDSGNAEAYMEGNWAFHFEIYRAHGETTLNHLIEVLWLQFGPFMRVVYGRFGTAKLVDQHERALEAIRAGDANALASAIHGDIADGMGLVGLSGLDP